MKRKIRYINNSSKKRKFDNSQKLTAVENTKARFSLLEEQTIEGFNTIKTKLTELNNNQSQNNIDSIHNLLNDILKLNIYYKSQIQNQKNLNELHNINLEYIDDLTTNLSTLYYLHKNDLINDILLKSVENSNNNEINPSFISAIQIILAHAIDEKDINLIESFFKYFELNKISNINQLFNTDSPIIDYSLFEITLINFLDNEQKQIDFDMLNLLLTNNMLKKDFDLISLINDNEAKNIDPYALIQLYKFGFDIDKKLLDSVDNNLIELLSNSKKDIVVLLSNDLEELKYEGSAFLKYNSKLLNNILKAIIVRSNLDEKNNWPSADDIKIDEYNLSLKIQGLQQIVNSLKDDNILPKELISLLNILKAASGIEINYDNADFGMFLRSLVDWDSDNSTILENLLQLASINDQAGSTEVLGQSDAMEL